MFGSFKFSGVKKPSKKVLDSIDMSSILNNIPENDTNRIYIDQEAGKEHYRLLVWLGKKVKGRILELGTFRGHSALALGLAGNRVVSCDIEDHLSLIKKPENISFVAAKNGFSFIDEGVKLVLIDTLHDGIFELQVLNHLRSINWKGIVILDDIKIFPELTKLWDEIPERKEDWTDIGHFSGTGLIWFE